MSRRTAVVLFVVVVLALLMLFAPQTAENETSSVALSMPPGTRLSNVGFGDGGTDYVDLQFPESPPVGVVVWLHGGGWIAGSRTTSFSQDIPQWLVKRGWVLASVDYRLTHGTAQSSPTNTFPAAVNDVQRATLWMESHLARFGIPSRVVLAGVSAGGNLAIVASVATADVSHVVGVPPHVDGVFSVSGPTDLGAMFLTDTPVFSTAAALYGGCDTTRVGGDIRNCTEQTGFWEQMWRAGVAWNLIHAVSAGAWVPPIYMVGGVGDRLVDPVVHIDPIVALWREATGDVRFAQSDVVFGAGHNLTTDMIDVDGLSRWLSEIVRGDLSVPSREATRQRLREVRL